MIETETFLSLLRDRAHWEFELFLMALFDGVIGLGLWPFVSKHVRHHLAHDKQDAAKKIGERVPMKYEFKVSKPPLHDESLVDAYMRGGAVDPANHPVWDWPSASNFTPEFWRGPSQVWARQWAKSLMEKPMNYYVKADGLRYPVLDAAAAIPDGWCYLCGEVHGAYKGSPQAAFANPVDAFKNLYVDGGKNLNERGEYKVGRTVHESRTPDPDPKTVPSRDPWPLIRDGKPVAPKAPATYECNCSVCELLPPADRIRITITGEGPSKTDTQENARIAVILN